MAGYHLVRNWFATRRTAHERHRRATSIPKTLENAKRQFVELYGSALVLNTYLKIALVLVSLVAARPAGAQLPHRRRYAHVKPLVIRIDDVGRAEAVQYDATALPAAAAGAALLPDAVRREALQPHPRHGAARVSRTRCSSWSPRSPTPRSRRTTRAASIETFLTNPSADEIDVVVQNVSLSELTDAAVQGGGELPEGVLHARHAARARPGDVRRAGRFRAARPRARTRSFA